MALSSLSIGILISRIVGIYIAIIVIGYIPSIMFFPTWFMAFAFFLHLCLSYVFLFHAPRISTALMSGTSSTDHDSTLTAEELKRAAFVIIGILTLVRAIPTFLGEGDSMLFGVPSKDRPAIFLIRPALEIALGVWLVVGTRSLLQLISRVRGMP